MNYVHALHIADPLLLLSLTEKVSVDKGSPPSGIVISPVAGEIVPLAAPVSCIPVDHLTVTLPFWPCLTTVSATLFVKTPVQLHVREIVTSNGSERVSNQANHHW